MRTVRTVMAATAGVLVAATALAAPAQSATRDRCLNGTWKMSAAEATAYMTAIMNATSTAGASMTVQSGPMTASFARGTVTVANPSYTFTSTANGGTVKGTANVVAKTPYTTARGKVVVGNGTIAFSLTDATATIDGNTISIPMDIPAIETGPSTTAYRCTAKKLTWSVPVPSGAPVNAVFTRN